MIWCPFLAGCVLPLHREIQEYFLNTYHMDEVLFSAVRSKPLQCCFDSGRGYWFENLTLVDEKYMYKCPDRLRLPLIFYLAHPATLYVNKLLLAGLISVRQTAQNSCVYMMTVFNCVYFSKTRNEWTLGMKLCLRLVWMRCRGMIQWGLCLICAVDECDMTVAFSNPAIILLLCYLRKTFVWAGLSTGQGWRKWWSIGRLWNSWSLTSLFPYHWYCPLQWNIPG